MDGPWELAVCCSELKPGALDNLEGWGRVRGEGEVQEGGMRVCRWLIHVDV